MALGRFPTILAS